MVVELELEAEIGIWKLICLDTTRKESKCLIADQLRDKMQMKGRMLIGIEELYMLRLWPLYMAHVFSAA